MTKRSGGYFGASKSSCSILNRMAPITSTERESGRALADRIAMKVDTGKSFIGVKLLFDGSVEEGAQAGFEVVGVGPDGKQTALNGVKWEIQRIETQFQWYSRDNRWSY